jgi:hypothetical protein
MLPSLIVIDNFLKNPNEARRKALELNYDPALNHGNYAGLTSETAMDIEGLEATVSRQINIPLQPAQGTVHGHCRLTLAKDKGRSGIHIDPCFYSGILYLSRDGDARGGTDFYKHRRTGLDGVPHTQAELLKAGYNDPNSFIEDVVNKDTTRPERWQRVQRVPMKFNRLILFSPWLFHNAGSGFGNQPENGRLVCLMFFNRASQ